jgi:hypothetical protein
VCVCGAVGPAQERAAGARPRRRVGQDVSTGAALLLWLVGGWSAAAVLRVQIPFLLEDAT